MNWQEELDELRARERMAREMGGPDKVRRQHEGGRLTVRERIEALIDAGSFHEIGAIAGKADYDAAGGLLRLTPSNCVMGRAHIEGRPVVVVGDDFTVRGGSADATIPTKPILAERMAGQLRLPIVRIIEGSGGGGSVKTIETSGRANLPGGLGQSSIGFQLLAETLSTVPVVALGLGSVAGLGAARLAASHYSVMTKGTSAMFVAGPPVVARAGQQLDKQTLGGWEVQCRAGAVDHAVETEQEAFQCARRFLSYLPASAYDVAARGDRSDPTDRREEMLFNVVPHDRRKVYRMRPIIEAVVDSGSLFEVGAHVRPLDHHRTGASGRVAGGGPGERSVSLRRGVDCGGLPEDCALRRHGRDLPFTGRVSGGLPGLSDRAWRRSAAATIRHGVRAMAAINQSSVPWCTIIVRNAFGVAGAAHVPAGRLALRYAWLSGLVGVAAARGRN